TAAGSTSTSRWWWNRSRTAPTTPSSPTASRTPSPNTRPLHGTNADRYETVGLAAFVQLVILGLLAGGVYVAVGVGFGLVRGVLNIVNPYVRLASLGAAILLSTGLAFLLSRTRIGLSIHAIAADRDAAQLVGIDLRHAYAVTYGLGAACAGVAGGLIAMIQAITPTAGEPYTLQAFVVVILGGLGRVSATVVGGLAFGLVEAFGQSIPG